MERDRQLQPPESEVPGRIRFVVGRLGRRLRQTSAGAGLTPSQYEVLVTIARQGPLRLSKVAVVEGLNPTMLSRIAGKLESSGLIGGTPDPSDGRAVLFAATEKGQDLVSRIRRERTDVLTVAIDALQPHERRVLEAALPVLESIAETLRGPTF